MNKRFFNQQNLTRRLRMLFVLFAMLLLPLGAWAQTITVAGHSPAEGGAIEGDGITGTVSFNASTNTLTLNGATIDMSAIPGLCPIESSIANLTIHLIGHNTLTPNSDNLNGIKFTEETTTGNLTFTTSNVVEEYGSLSVEGIYQFSHLTSGYNVTNSFKTGEQTGWSKTESGGSGQTYNSVRIDYIEYYDVWIGGARLSSSNLSPVSGGTVYIPSTHTLHLAGYGYGDGIKSGLSEFIVEVSGSYNSVSNITFEGDTPGTIIFKKDESSVSGNKVDFTGSVKGFSSVTITPPLQLVSPSGVDNPTSEQWNSFENVKIADYVTTYNITVGGKNVTNANASNVLGDGTVSYDSENNILTLNDATIIPESEEYGITYTGTTDLVISLNGTNNVVKGVGGCPAIGYFNNDVQTFPSLTFTNGSETDPCKLQLESVSTATIGGFGSVVNTGLYKIEETILGGDQPNTYKTTITSTILSGGSGTSANPFIVGTADDLKNFAKYVNDGILSTEYIKLGGNIDCTNLTGFEPIGNTPKSFIGTFNGDGNSITGLTFSNTNPDGVAGLFGNIGSYNSNNDVITRGTVKNLTLNGCQFGNGARNGAIAGYLNYGTIENCTVTSCTISSGNSQSTYSGGITGMVVDGIVKDCTVNGGTITSSTTDSNSGEVCAGGIVAYAYGSSEINGCTVADVSINSTGINQNSCSGGIVGYSEATISGNSVKGSTTVNSINNNNENVFVGAIVANRAEGSLTSNDYYYTVNTKTTIGSNDPVEKSGYTERGVGGTYINENQQEEPNPDVTEDNGAVMYTKTLTLTDGVIGECEPYEPLSNSASGIFALAPGLDFDIDLAPKTAGMVISAVSLVYTPTGGTEQTVVLLENESETAGEYNYVFKMPDANATLNATIVQTYDLWIGETQVTSANAANVLGNGTVSFSENVGVDTAPTYTLTLNGATIIPTTECAGIKYTGTANLTICLNGTNNVVKGGGNCNAILYDGTGVTAPTLTFTNGGTAPCSLQLEAVGVDLTTIAGFASVVNTGLYRIDDTESLTKKTTITSLGGGSGTAADPIIIKTTDDLKNFSKLVNNGTINTAAMYFRLAPEGGTLDCSELDGFEPIGSGSQPFQGTFSGNGCTISNLIAYEGGLFGNISGATIEDLNLSNCTIAGNDYRIAGLATDASNGSTINLCTITNSTIECLSNQYDPTVGGIVARLSDNETTISNCVVNNTQIKAEATNSTGTSGIAGGIVGEATSGKIENCHIKGESKITDYNNAGATLYAGAIVGKYTGTTLSANYYYYDVTVETLKGTDTANKVAKDGYTQRALGNGDDVSADNGAVMYTQKVTFPTVTGATITKDGDYYSYDDTGINVAPGQTATMIVEPSEGNAISSFTATNVEDADISSEALTENRTRYSFEMPDDAVTVTLIMKRNPELAYKQGETAVTTAEWTLGKDDNTALPVLQNPHNLAPVTYESNNTDVATVATDGTVTVVGIGTAVITATTAETDEYAVGKASYTLTVKRQLNVSFTASNEWATYYGTENLAMPEGLKAYQVTAVDGSTVTIGEIGYIPANTAVLLKNVSNNNTWSNIAASAYTGATSTFASNKLIGTAEAVNVSDISGGTVYVLYNNMFKRASGGTIPANRGYLVVATSSNAPQLSISIGDENTTAISNTDFTDNTDKAGEWYSIDGVKLNGQPQKPGLYIKNGKKVFINKK